MLSSEVDIRTFETTSNEILILTPEYVFTKIQKEHESQFIAALRDEGDLPKHGDVFLIKDILKVSTNKKGRLITIVSRAQFRSTSTDFVVFLDPHTREDFIQYLHIHMGQGYKYTKEELSSGQAAIKPLFSSIIIVGLGIFLTWFATIAQQQPIEEGRVVKAQVRLLYKVLSMIGPMGVIIISGLAFLICLIIFVRRVQNPPMMLRIKRGK